MGKINADVNEDEITIFVKLYCLHKQYDSCLDSPCMYSSWYGCQHPKYPKKETRNGDTNRQNFIASLNISQDG